MTKHLFSLLLFNVSASITGLIITYRLLKQICYLGTLHSSKPASVVFFSPRFSLSVNVSARNARYLKEVLDTSRLNTSIL